MAPPRLVLFALAGAVAACAQAPSTPAQTALAPEPPLPGQVQATESERPVIVNLKLRDQTLRVTASGAGPRFVVLDAASEQAVRRLATRAVSAARRRSVADPWLRLAGRA